MRSKGMYFIRYHIYFALLFSFFVFTGSSVAQTDSKKSGSLTVTADNRLDSLVQIHKKNNEEKQSTPGYRVQLFFGTDRKKATDIKSSFLQTHADISSYVIYQQPNYKVRVGDFRTRLEAYKLLQQLSKEFPSAFLVKDDVVLPSLE